MNIYRYEQTTKTLQQNNYKMYKHKTLFFNCGLLFSKKKSYISLSLERIAEIKLHTSEVVIFSIEINTRVTKKKIAKVMAAATKYYYKVYCAYGDPVFRYCVSVENCLQLLHQSAVLGTSYGVYIVSKVEHVERCILHVGCFKINDDDKYTYSKKIRDVGDPMLGWVRRESFFEKG